MTETPLLEPSFADAAKAIETTVDLPARTRSQWLCSLRQIAKALDKPTDIIPATLDVGALRHWPTAPCPRRGEREDARQPQVKRTRSTPLVRQ